MPCASSGRAAGGLGAEDNEPENWCGSTRWQTQGAVVIVSSPRPPYVGCHLCRCLLQLHCHCFFSSLPSSPFSVPIPSRPLPDHHRCFRLIPLTRAGAQRGAPPPNGFGWRQRRPCSRGPTAFSGSPAVADLQMHKVPETSGGGAHAAPRVR